jgi:LPS export ABC transporter protein LptC
MIDGLLNHSRSLLSGVFFASAIALLSSCINDEKKVQAFFEKKLGVDEARQVESYMSQGGKMKAKLTAPLMLRYQDTLPRVEFPNTLHVDFYSDSLHQVESQVDAHFGKYIESQSKVFLRDSVRVFNIQGDTLHCQELWWDQTSAKFTTDKPVRIYRKDLILIGEGLSAPQDFKTFEIYHPTNSIIRVPANQFGE